MIQYFDWQGLGDPVAITWKDCAFPLDRGRVARIGLHNFGHADHYSGVRVSIVGTDSGLIDQQTFRFSDVMGKRDDHTGRGDYYVWVSRHHPPDWYGSVPTDDQWRDFAAQVEAFVSLFK